MLLRNPNWFRSPQALRTGLILYISTRITEFNLSPPKAPISLRVWSPILERSDTQFIFYPRVKDVRILKYGSFYLWYALKTITP